MIISKPLGNGSQQVDHPPGFLPGGDLRLFILNPHGSAAELTDTPTVTGGLQDQPLPGCLRKLVKDKITQTIGNNGLSLKSQAL